MVAQDHGSAPGPAAPELAHRHPFDLAPLGTAATHAVVTPTFEKATDAANVGGPAETKAQCVIFEQSTDDGKRFATLRALLALKSHVLSRTHADDGPARFYVNCWGMARELRNLAAVARLLDQLGGAHA